MHHHLCIIQVHDAPNCSVPGSLQHHNVAFVQNILRIIREGNQNTQPSWLDIDQQKTQDGDQKRLKTGGFRNPHYKGVLYSVYLHQNTYRMKKKRASVDAYSVLIYYSSDIKKKKNEQKWHILLLPLFLS